MAGVQEYSWQDGVCGVGTIREGCRHTGFRRGTGRSRLVEGAAHETACMRPPFVAMGYGDAANARRCVQGGPRRRPRHVGGRGPLVVGLQRQRVNKVPSGIVDLYAFRCWAHGAVAAAAVVGRVGCLLAPQLRFCAIGCDGELMEAWYSGISSRAWIDVVAL